ncbi:phage tail protein [Lelliottia amnigena]|uniref:phage tail protein n=1 Tax=Lelliottia amnigena TaxID=61646 RepID=UPI0020B29FB8|nr:phage tail protein [Lelliottia amnigena]
MALTLLANNNAQTVLAAGINATATTLTVSTGTGNLFPSPVTGASFFKLTLVDSATGSLSEIVHVTSRTGDTMTIEREKEGTTARIWSANDIAANMLTAGSLQLYAQKDQSLLIDNNLSEIANAGPAAVATALANLGLSSGAPAIGIPFYWPSAALPNTVMPEWAGMVFLKHNGAAFSGVTYPKLALVYPGLVLPDTRGEFIRNWDDGRGVDSGRALLSAQAATGIGRYVGSDGADTIAGVDLPDSQYAGSASWSRVPITTSPRLGQTYNAVKPRSIAFNFIVRAA